MTENQPERSLQYDLFTPQRELVVKRLGWDNEMLGMLERRKSEILKELGRIEGQIAEIQEDKARLWEVINGGN